VKNVANICDENTRPDEKTLGALDLYPAIQIVHFAWGRVMSIACAIWNYVLPTGPSE